jgi:hypothetical protein
MQKADRVIFPAPFIDVLAALFLDESLITHLHFLPDILAVCQLSREIYSWCRAVPHHRLEGILHRFFLGSLDHFLTYASDGDHHYRKLCSKHVTGKFVRFVFK